MGSVIEAECECGYMNPELLLGGGFRNFMTECAVPFYCDHCKKVFTLNILDKNGLIQDCHCPRCKRKVHYYGYIKEGTYEYNEDYVFDWRVNSENRYFLPEGLHHCPKCKKDKLQFYETACWD
jgi:hypothetical protein